MNPICLNGAAKAAVALGLAGLLALTAPVVAFALDGAGNGNGAGDEGAVEAGRRMYRDGLLPSGEIMTGIIQGDIRLTGEQVICGLCHRRSGMGSTEGQDVIPAVTGDLLYNPLRLPTSKPPFAPEQRPAYTDATLKRAIRDGIGADGQPLSALMPRYPLTDAQLDTLLAYLKSMTTDPDPGVTERDMHFATILSDAVDPRTRQAFVAVFDAFFKQKNTETRGESGRKAHAPWHKEMVFGPYRKWVLHVWDLQGPPDTWDAQLRAHYARQPVFAVLSGLAAGNWRPIHGFCEQQALPCLFPATDLPVVAEQDFYSVYLTRGMSLEADAVLRHLTGGGQGATPVVQVYRTHDPKSAAAAARFREAAADRGVRVTNFAMTGKEPLADDFWNKVLAEQPRGDLVLWLDGADLESVWDRVGDANGRWRVYLSTTLFDPGHDGVPPGMRGQVYFVHPYELPARLPRLLARSRGWLKAKRIYSPEAERVQADAFLALQMATGAVKAIKSYYLRDYLIESIEHMVDNANYTSVYPRVSLAPGQRFISRGAYIAQLPAEGTGGLVAVSEWLVP